MTTSYDVFITTVKELARAQGFYSRIWADIQTRDDEQLEQLKNEINNNFNFKTSLDIIMELEA